MSDGGPGRANDVSAHAVSADDVPATEAAQPGRPVPPAQPALPARAVVAAHGDLASGLVSAVAQITGRGELFVPLSNVGMGRERLDSVLREALEEAGAGIVFTDLPGGSWTIAARRVQRDQRALVVVTGVNLAMLLEYAFHEAAPAHTAAAAALEKGRSAMLVAGGAVVD